MLGLVNWKFLKWNILLILDQLGKIVLLKNQQIRLAWQHFTATINFPKKGYYEIWAKATILKE